MKEIQAQLNDFKKRAENAEQVTQQAERRAVEAEKHLRVEKENAAAMIAEACHQLCWEDDERTAFENMQAMIIEDFERRLPAGQVQQKYPRTPGPSSTRENADDSDMPEDQGGFKTPRVRYLSHCDPPY